MSVEATASALAEMAIPDARRAFSAIVDQARTAPDEKEARQFNALLATELRERGVPIWDDKQ